MSFWTSTLVTDDVSHDSAPHLCSSSARVDHNFVKDTDAIALTTRSDPDDRNHDIIQIDVLNEKAILLCQNLGKPVFIRRRIEMGLEKWVVILGMEGW